MAKTLRYPLGMQTFSKIIEEGRVYVDKTGYVYNMTHADSSYIFLSRPRRFGKSLLTSTLRSYFEGRRELFKGLAIEQLEKEWTEYPVLHFDMSTAKHADKVQLVSELNLKLLRYEEVYGKNNGEVEPNQRLQGLITRAYNQTGKPVVVLIDEYDAPLLDVMHEETELPILRQVMRNFYSPLKSCEPMLRFVFLTGITKFSQLSIFSELNNLANISMLPEYAAICGITEEEMITQMDEGITAFAETLEMTKSEAVQALKANYDGYHFSWPSPDIYNPFSLLNALSWNNLDSYWFGSGTPTYLIEMLRKYNVTPAQLCERLETKSSAFDAPTERMTTITPLLYQSGYITIKDYNNKTKLYTLGFPNKEIRIGLLESILPNYLGMVTDHGITTVAKMCASLRNNDIKKTLELLQKFLATVPQTDNTSYEGHWQQMLFVIFKLLGAEVDVEVRTCDGRVDMVVRTALNLYLFELKLNKSAQDAMEQINLKDYPSRFALSGLPITKVGINFSVEKRNITDWTIE